MKIGIIARILIVSKIAIMVNPAHAWVVSNNIVELPKELEQLVKPSDIKNPPEVVNPLHSQVENVSTPLVRAVDVPIFEKTLAKLTEDEEALVDYQQAKEHLQQGEAFLAEQLLKNILNQVPTHVASRIELAN